MFNQCENVFLLFIYLSDQNPFVFFILGVLADVNGIERPIFVSLLVSAIFTPIQLVHHESVIPDRSLQVLYLDVV